MSVKFANNAFGTLNAGISNSATSLTLSSGQGARFPTLASGEYFYATLIDTSNNLEVVKCTARSTDVLTITRAQESTTAQAFAIGDRIELRVTAGGLEDAANPYDKDTSSTGSFALPVGTTAQQPTAADSEGHIRYDSDESIIYFSDGANWLKISSIVPFLSSVTGNIFAGAATTLTLAGTGFLAANLVVNFTQSSDSIDTDVTVTPTSDTAATVTVPAAVYNNVTAGNVVSVTATNSDGVTSAAVSKTALALPSGGTVTTSGGYRIHTFTSSGTFTNTVANLSTEYLVIGGGGGGGIQHGGGGGAGGYRSSVSGESSGGGASAETALSLATGNHTATVGAGGSGVTTLGSFGGLVGTNGANSVFSTITSTGGGGGSSMASPNVNGASGGSGGGSALDGTGGSGTSAGGAGTSGQGFSGGTYNGYSATNYGGGSGGGGAGSVGEDAPANGSSYNAGDGGSGVSSNITGSAVTRAGGGGGGSHNPFTAGSGGTGGGGAGGTGNVAPAAVGGNATANLGGGGGGSGSNDTVGGNGASGIVIIRYQL